MSTILIVDEDADLTASVARDLDPDRFRVVVAHAAPEAEQALEQQPIDVLLVDRDLNGRGARTLLELAQASVRNVAPIVMMSNATAKDAADALDAGAAAVLDKPFSPSELVDAIDRAARAGLRGNLEGISLLDMLQVFHISRRSMVLSMAGDPPTRIWFEGGEVVHAERGEEVGEDVLHRVLEARTGAIRTLPFEPTDRTIDRAFQSLLLDILRSRDESRRDPPAEDMTELRDEDFSDDLIPAVPVEVPEEARVPAPPPEVESAVAEPIATPPPPSPTDTEPELPIPAPVAPPVARTALPSRPLDPICAAVNAEIPGALATALIDLDLGSLRGLYNRASFTPDFERFIALYTRSLFRGPEIQHIERTMEAQRGVGTGAVRLLEEIVLSSRHTHHLTKVIKDGRFAVMVVTPRRADVQQTWQSLRTLIRGLESNLD